MIGTAGVGTVIGDLQLSKETKCEFTGLRVIECAHCHPSESLEAASAYDAAHPELLDILVDEQGNKYVEYFEYGLEKGIEAHLIQL